ncbi:MAG: recombinase family protein [Alphaproteobacteria bacterium]|nr:recombinase family protein [Alphaproteobacteria bacterium]
MQKLMWNMGTVMAQSYTDQLTDNVRRSIKHKLEKGEWIAQAPLGYLNVTDEVTGRSHVVIDPQRAHLVKKLFMEYAAGVYSMSELRRKTEQWGLVTRKNKALNLQTVAGILSNPFYCGLMRIKGHLYPHTYPQLIEHEIFRACEKRKRNPQKVIKISRHPFLLRGMITCAMSGRKVTCDLKKGRYVYLVARNPADDSKVWVKEEAVVKQLQDILRSFKLPDDLLSDVLDYIKQTHEAEKGLHLSRIKELRIEDNNLSTKLNRLTDLLVDGHIDSKVYEAKHKEIAMRRTEINCILKDNHDADDKFKDALLNIVKLVSKSYDLFESSKTDEKRGLLGFVFSNLQLEGATLRYTLRKPFEQLAQLPHNPKWRAQFHANRRYCHCPQ